MLVSKKIAEIKKAELEAGVAAEIQKNDSANYSDIASDSESDMEEEHETCKARSNVSRNLLNMIKEEKEKESAETSLGLMEYHRPPPCYKPISKPSREVEPNNERNILGDSGMEKIIPRADQKETTNANENRADSWSASLPINFPRPDSPDRFKEKKEKESAETSLKQMENHRPPPCEKPISTLTLANPKPQRKPSQEVELNNERNTVDDSGMEKIRPRADQKETTNNANENRADSWSAPLPTNLPRPDSPEYDEISDTEIDRYVSKPLEEDAINEMDYKFRLLKAILERIDDKNEKQRQFEVIYQEYAAWCEIRIDSKVMMYFVHKFHTECALYMRKHHGIEVNVRRYENEIIRRTEDPKWTDAQKLKRKVLQRRKSKPAKKKICAQKVEVLFNELLAEEFHNVLACGPLSIWTISSLIECSKSKRDCFSKTLCKYDKYGELPGLLEKVLIDKWIFFFYSLPHNGFGERDTLNEYERVRRDLPLNFPHGTHITFLSDIKEWFVEKKKKREREEREERERRENEEKRRQAERLRRLEDEKNSRKRFSFLKLPSICNPANSHGTTPQYQEHPQAINRHQPGSRSNQRTDDGQEMERFGNRAGGTQDFHY